VSDSIKIIMILAILLAAACLATVNHARDTAREVTSVYWVCNKDNVQEMLVNAPNGMSAAIATHCEKHTYIRKM
jgi:hypothetical protein